MANRIAKLESRKTLAEAKIMFAVISTGLTAIQPHCAALIARAQQYDRSSKPAPPQKQSIININI